MRTQGNVAAGEAGRGDDRFASLIDGDRRGTMGVAIALGLAMVFGMAHAMTPGHGKAMVAAYLAGTRGTARHAFALGATVTITHTAGVFALGLVTLSLSQFILPETLYPWLNLASGVMVLAIGLYAFRDRLRRWLGGRVQPADVEHGHGHAHGGHGHAHDGGHGHTPDAGHGHAPTTATPRTAATATATPTAGTGTRTRHPTTCAWRSLIALGISGGLIPCPSALVVLLSAIALHQVAFGMALIVAFSFGLAAIVSGIGLTVIYARRLFQHLPADRGRFVAALPIASAAIITTPRRGADAALAARHPVSREHPRGAEAGALDVSMRRGSRASALAPPPDRTLRRTCDRVRSYARRRAQHPIPARRAAARCRIASRRGFAARATRPEVKVSGWVEPGTTRLRTSRTLTVSRHTAPLRFATSTRPSPGCAARGFGSRRPGGSCSRRCSWPTARSSAEELAAGLGGRVPRSDLASVYRNLETLERHGVVRHVHLGHGPGLLRPGRPGGARVPRLRALRRLSRRVVRRRSTRSASTSA